MYFLSFSRDSSHHSLLQSGKALANGGPVGAFLGYLMVGMLVGLMMYA
jgi:amino acid permease